MTGERVESSFFRSADRSPERLATDGAGGPRRYRELRALAHRVAAALPEAAGDDSARVAVLATRGPLACAALLGVLARGLVVVPISPSDPPARVADLLARSGAALLLTDDVPRARAIAGDRPVLSLHDLPEAPAPTPPVDPCAVAQCLFTSGTTGAPRAVEIRHDALCAFVRAATSRWAFHETDRFSQLFDLAFDLHGFDLFVAWSVGACVVVPSPGAALLAVSWCREAELTVWFSSPSAGELARRLGGLRPGALPALRWVGFCGEPLPDAVAEAWAAAAPGAGVHDLYGPTELTIACTAHTRRPGDAVDGLVPIGRPLDGVQVLVVDADGREVDDGPGELVADGIQRAAGYRGDPEATAARFVALPGRPGTWYRTGDLVRKLPDGALAFVGRVDDQVQVRGHRVEPRGVEAALRAIPGVHEATVLPWPVRGARVEGLAAFVVADRPVDALRADLAGRLPPSHVPTTWRLRDHLPLTSRGKVDRAALLDSLRQGP